MKCPGCSADLRLDPASGKLLCDFCGSSFDPTDKKLLSFPGNENAEENIKAAEYADTAVMHDEVDKTSQNNGIELTGAGSGNNDIDVIEYTCPNCGGTLVSVEEAVNGFCSYCGSQVMLNTRFSKMKAPKCVIPFSVSKEQCREKYLGIVKSAFFAPKELKDPEYLEKFRGIYMPYYVYNIRSEGPFKFKGKRSYTKGNYEYTETYECNVELNSHYNGLSYDASSSFDDHFSELIGPFDSKKMKDYSSSYLSGFYADLADVPYTLYMNDAGDFVKEDIMKKLIKGNKDLSNISIEGASKDNIPLMMTKKDIETAFFPVWFLSYKKGDRVAYAVVNGESGKLVCDLPVDVKKFILCSVGLALPLYILFNLFLPVFQPGTMLMILQILGCIAAILMSSNVKKAVIRDDHLDDKGYIYKYGNGDYSRIPDPSKKKKLMEKLDNAKVAVFAAVVMLIYMFGLPALSVIFSIIFWLFKLNIFKGPAETVLVAIVILSMFAKGKTLDDKKIMFMGGIPLLIASVISTILAAAAPANDMFYFASAIVMGIGILAALLSVILIFNGLSTRPLPQLNRKGGDDSAPVNR